MMKKHRRLISIILIAIILVPGAFTIKPVEAFAITQVQCQNLDANANLNPPPTFPICSTNGMPFNTTYWNDLGIVVYGDVTKIPNNQFKPKWQNLSGVLQNGSSGAHPYFNGGEYRYYGWDKLGNLFTNPYFINDKNGSDPGERKWIYRPWSNSLLSGHPNKPTDFSPLLGGRFDNPDAITGTSINIVNQIIKTQAVTVQNSTINDLTKYLFNYMYVQQNPTVWAPGSGRMFSIGANNKVWYQTFMLDEITSKALTPVVAKIDPFPADNPSINDKYPNGSSVELNSFPSNTFNLKFRMSGTIQDDAFMTGTSKDYMKAANYTREDLEKWELKIEVQHQGKPLTTLKTFTTPDVILYGNQGYNDIDIPVIKSDYAEGGTLKVFLTATATYHNKQTTTKKSSVPVQYTLSFDEPAPEPTSIPDPPPEVVVIDPLVCTPNIPQDAFDIVPFVASDNTDMSRVQSRSVIIDGLPVNDTQFFSGAYIFGDEQDGLRMVTVNWTPKTPAFDGDQGCQETRYVKVHDTKPRAQYKMSGGTWKENRKMTIDNTSLDPNVNNPYVIAAYPINNWSWSFEGTNGSSDSDRRMGINSDMVKEMLYKKKGTYRITLTATNTLGRTSDPYIVDFSILQDYAPAVILHPYSSQIGRGESVSMFYDVVSTDGDIIDTHSIKIYYDVNNNHSFSQLITTLNSPLGSEYTPPANQLGRYKIVATVDENFGQDTLASHITTADKRITTVETVFEVDNYIPYSDIFTNIPFERAEVDLYLMLDRNLTQSKINYVNANGVTINNQLRLESMDPQVNSWDLHTYTYSQPASTSSSTGTSYPPSSVSYSSNSYSGTLSRSSVSNNGYNYDYGGYQTVNESKSASDSRSQSGSGIACSQTVSSTIPSSVSYSSDGYSGTLSQSSYSYSSTPCTAASGWKYSFSRSASYSGTVYRSRQVWVSNIQYVNQYTGYYSGTIYKDVRQSYTNPFTRITSNKYMVYISDGIINDLTDFNTARAQSDAKIILVGSNSIKTQTTFDHFILNTGQSIETIIVSVVDYIASFNPPISTETVELNELFNLYTQEIDSENDPLITQQTMYIHNPSFYDNPQGTAAYAVSSYNANAWEPQMLRTSFTLPGQYTVYRRVQDRPSISPAFAPYSYFSNESHIRINAHRKPIALATLDWTYTTNCSCYRTVWVDQSYDLDHQFSDKDKGIIDRKVRYRQGSGSWVYAIPDFLSPGTYTLEYQVKDLELAWSNVYTLNFTLSSTPSIQLTANARTELGTFTMSSIPASEQLRIYNIWTRYPYSHSLSVALFQGNTQMTTAQTVSYYTGTKTGDDITWNDIVYTIPASTPDGIYNLRLTAIGQAGQTNYLEFPVTVNTPINLLPTVPASGDTIVVNQSYGLAAGTSKYASTVTASMFYGSASPVSRTFTSTTQGALKSWLNSYLIPSRTNGNYIARFTATTPSGKTQSVNVPFILINNRPPVANFDWSPKPVWEGDTIKLSNLSSDPDGDSLSYLWTIKRPNGTTYMNSTIAHTIYSPTTGAYVITLRATDTQGSSHTITKTVNVGALGITAQVGHTDSWNDKRAGYNIKYPDDARTDNQFWAGERFDLSAQTTDTGSATIAEAVWTEVSGTAYPITQPYQWHPAWGLLNRNLSYTNVKRTIWEGEVNDPPLDDFRFPDWTKLEQLDNGYLDFVFKVQYSNGVIKQTPVRIHILNKWTDMYQIHRVQ